jgi:pyruvate-formate lyase-activating enzyme
MCCAGINMAQNVLGDLGFLQRELTSMYEDNQSCIAIAKNSMIKSRSNHIKIRYPYSREMILFDEYLKAMFSDARALNSVSPFHLLAHFTKATDFNACGS